MAVLREEGRQIRLQDEMFFSTVNYNPHLKAPGSCLKIHLPNGSDPRTSYVARHVEWNPPPCLSKRVQRTVCIMGVRDLPKLTKSQRFFVNKFIDNFEPLAYDCLEWWLFEKIDNERGFGRTAAEFDTSFYENLYCSKDHF